jgi:hypothetical protein
MTDVLLLERYRTAYAEYRAEVALGWDRQKFFVGLPATLTALVSSIGTHRIAARVALGTSALVALAGALIVMRSHGRYRAARATLLAIETELGIQDLQTTGGQREARGGLRLEAWRIADVLVVVFLLIAALDVALAVLW